MSIDLTVGKVFGSTGGSIWNYSNNTFFVELSNMMGNFLGIQLVFQFPFSSRLWEKIRVFTKQVRVIRELDVYEC